MTMVSTGWRREGAGLFDVPVGAIRLLQGNKARDPLLAAGGVRALPPALAAHTGPEA